MKRKMTFEQAGERLDAILSELSDEKTPLDRALSLYAEAAELIEFSAKAVAEAKIAVEEIDAKLVAVSGEE